MTKACVKIWGRKFKLDVVYDCYEGEAILPVQEQAYEGIIKRWSHVDASLNAVKRYCLEQYGDEIEGDTIDNVFKYVMPQYLFILRNENKHTVALMCDFRFDPEHGLAIVFENEKLSRIGEQDIVL